MGRKGDGRVWERWIYLIDSLVIRSQKIILESLDILEKRNHKNKWRIKMTLEFMTTKGPWIQRFCKWKAQVPWESKKWLALFPRTENEKRMKSPVTMAGKLREQTRWCWAAQPLSFKIRKKASKKEDQKKNEYSRTSENVRQRVRLHQHKCINHCHGSKVHAQRNSRPLTMRWFH